MATLWFLKHNNYLGELLSKKGLLIEHWLRDNYNVAPVFV